MDEIFRDLSHTAQTPRTGSAGRAQRAEQPGYLRDLSQGAPAPRAASRGSAAPAARERAARPVAAPSSDGLDMMSGGRGLAYSAGGRTAPRSAASGGRSAYGAASGGHAPRSSASGGRSGSGSGRSSVPPVSGGGGRSSSGGSGRRRRQQQKRQRAILFGMLLLLLLLVTAVVVIVRSCAAASGPADPATIDTATATFADEVYINGIPVSGMLLADARSAVMPGIEETVSRIAITLTGEMGGETFHETISGADMNITTDIEQVLLDALAGGRNKSYKTSLDIDYTALDQRIADINNALSFGPADATFTLTPVESGEPQLTYTEGHAGMGIDVPATEQLVREALEAGNYQASLTPPLTQQEPNITVDDLKQQISLISSFTTEYRNTGLAEWSEEKRQTTLNRAYNVEKAAGLINGSVVQPGRVWSYNDTVGDRNEKNGWKRANEITGGERYVLGWGGGVCQVSTTLYGALLRANLHIVERRKHSIPADYVPYGLDATVDTDHIDLRFENDTDYPLYIFAYTNVKAGASRKSEITVLIYGQALPEGVKYEPRTVTKEEIEPGEPIITYDDEMPAGEEEVTVEARNGYVVEAYLDKLVNGEVVESTLLHTDEYAAIAEKRTVGTMLPATPIPTPEPTPEPTIEPEPNEPEPADPGHGLPVIDTDDMP